jgi:CheY-like chemotaxis protein
MSDWEILVVEDEADSMELVRELLEYHGILSVGATTGEEAIQLLQKMNPTLIIIDLALPGIDGWGLLNHIQKNPRLAPVPCVAVTAYHNPTLANEAIAAGFDAYFAKPIDATSFVRELQGIIEESQL